jgi:hypothetical protein
MLIKDSDPLKLEGPIKDSAPLKLEGPIKDSDPLKGRARTLTP